MTEFPQLDSGLAVPVFTLRDDPISCLNKEMVFMSVVAASRFSSTNNQLRTSSNPRNQATIQDGRVTVQQVQGREDKVMMVLEIKVMLLVLGETMQEGRQGLLNAIIVKVKDTWLGSALSLKGQEIQHVLGKDVTEDLDAYDSDSDDVSTAQVVLIASLSNYGSNVLLEVPYFETYHNDMDNPSVHAIQDFKQTPVVDFSENEITSDSNIIPYSQYLQETQQVGVQDSNLYTQQDSMILSVIEQMSEL
ncbi:hypothetical protein Tco_0852499 [Tanacetum coccineum]